MSHFGPEKVPGFYNFPAQDRAATQTPRWGVRCFANAVLLGRAEPQTLLLTIWKLHDYAPLGPRELTLIGGIEL